MESGRKGEEVNGSGPKPLAGDTEEEWGYPRLRDLAQELNHI